MLAGCGPSPDSRPPSTVATEPSPESTAIATQVIADAYEKYLRAGDAVAADGGAHVKRLEPLVTPAQYQRELMTYERVRSAGLHSTGESHLKGLRVQQSSQSTAVAYVCLDVHDTRILDKSNKDVTPRARPNQLTLQVTFARDNHSILISKSVTWSGSSIC